MELQPSIMRETYFSLINNFTETSSGCCSILASKPTVFNKNCVCLATELVIGAQANTPELLCVLFKYNEYIKNNSM